MKENHPEEGSFVNRKRPAVEGLIEDILGPRAQLDEMISQKPWLNLEPFNDAEAKTENE